MKKYIPHVLIVFLYTIGSYAQSMQDALRYARPELKGTARYISMGGAFNALGGDFAAIKDNPAAAAVFINSEMGATVNTIDNQINAGYFGNTNTVNSEIANISQFGIVFALENAGAGEFTKLSFAYNYQISQNFDNKYNAVGTNNSRGIDNYFLAYAQGVEFRHIKTYDDETLSESYRHLGNTVGFGSQQAFLGYQGYVINPVQVADDNINYVSNSNPQNQPVNHDFFVTNSGNNSKHTFNISAQYRDNLYIGLNLNSHASEFRRLDNLIENNYGSGSSFSYTEFENELYTIGEGFSLQIGAIYKTNENLRMGLSYHSPVWYNFTDEYVQFIETSKDSGFDTVDPQIINIYEYRLITPSVYSGGLAYIFDNKGLLSLQYDFTDYRNLRFDIKNGDNNFINQNNKIKGTLQSASTLRIGGEYRIERFSIRGGYYNRQSINKINDDSTRGYSLGLGYDFGGSILSLGMFNQEIKRSESMYQEGLTDRINLNNSQTQFLLTYSIKL